jgi:hypothetical protein
MMKKEKKGNNLQAHPSGKPVVEEHEEAEEEDGGVVDDDPYVERVGAEAVPPPVDGHDDSSYRSRKEHAYRTYY